MPSLAELQDRSYTPVALDREAERDGELLVADSRARLSPSQLVEQKLRGTLGSGVSLTAGALIRRPMKPR